MHIGVYTECLSRRSTGVEVYTSALVKGLAKIDKVTCFHTSNPKHPRPENVNHFLFRRALPIPFYHRWAAFFHSNCFNNFDLLHVPFPQLPYIKKPKVPVVITVHDIIPLFMPQFHNWKRVLFFKSILPWYLKQADAIISVSNATKSDLIRYYRIPEDKIHVVHEAVPEARPFKSRKENYILYLGTIEPRKNVEGLIKAFMLMKKPGQKLIIAGGKGWKYGKVFKLIDKYKDDIIYKGYVSNAEKAELYQKASLFVYPSFYEGFGLPILEAMSYGTPVVTSNNSSLKEIAGNAAILVNPRSPEDIARGMNEALYSSAKLSQQCLKRVKKFTIERMLRETRKVYEGVVK